MLQLLTKRLLEDALDAQLDEHLAETTGAGTSVRKGGNGCNGYRSNQQSGDTSGT